MPRPIAFLLAVVASLALSAVAQEPPAGPRYVPLFPTGFYEGWTFGDWADVAQPQQTDGTPWRLDDGILAGLDKRTWIFSGEDYGDFALRFEWKLSAGGNAAVGLRFPPAGDPAYAGLAVQLVNHEKYFPNGSFPRQRTGAIYDALPPISTAEKPIGQWNAMEITCQQDRIAVLLNGVVVQEVDLAEHDQPPREGLVPLAERPKSGAIGFQNIRGTIQFRNLEIMTLDDPPAAAEENAPSESD